MHHKKFNYSICIEGEAEMGTPVTGSFTLVVNPPSTGTTLSLNPSSATLTPETEGVNDPGQLVTEVLGGVAPYAFSATGVPQGMTLSQQPDADGIGVDVILSGTPASGSSASSPYTIALTVTDSSGGTAQANIRGTVGARSSALAAGSQGGKVHRF
jgi:hypothetical protein